ncbi:prolyl-tRNA synthetase [Caldanaerobius fijiensis DSM 17918]|uniref:Proline--tRNA ligase n=1 Tax=Caldanaerobius fijiensis DSM 17918 TaxID=1121256 RepID=A0A1M5BXP2_9THEO|nr:proline--tRNA ligase [Caldanaerobius fijiensis]SHF47186.1 prolyl-tRNA synthetase [Caldanaerobius fijiensis DSM 17918]
MRLTQLFLPTLREVPAEAEITSHKYMLRAGLMRKLAAGVYVYLPLGYRVLRKIENIVREEMDRSGAQEVLMSGIIPSELLEESGRWSAFGPEMFKLKDRHERDFCLGPTHEEVFTYVMKELTSYRDLPKILYQIQTKYRDEKRPRFGVIRSREFIMKDAYSFDMDWEGLDVSFGKMHDAYCRIFDRCGLKYRVVQADSGAMGGKESNEFMVMSEVGEDEIAHCENCDYAANVERAESRPDIREKQEEKPLELVATPDARTIQELTDFFETSPDNFAKTLIYTVKDQVIAVVIRGDRELNEVKLVNILECTKDDLRMAEDDVVKNVTNAEVGFAGPVGLKVDKLIVDEEVTYMSNFIVGANKTGYHYKNVNYGRDFKGDIVVDVRKVSDGDVCIRCGGRLSISKGIEVGHIFKLGTKYSEALGAKYLDENGQEHLMIMGSYGIGINRIMAAVIEQNSDENGIIWPMSIAPYHVIIVPVNTSDEVQASLAEDLYDVLSRNGVEVLLDDRDERAGVKFKDADLIGIPIRITVGKKARDRVVEIKDRRTGESLDLTVDQVLGYIKQKIEENMSKKE